MIAEPAIEMSAADERRPARTLDPAIEVRGLVKAFTRPFRAPLPVLQGLDLAVPAGSAFGLIGPNGAGKTTFIKLLLGIIHPDQGQIRVLGGDPTDARSRLAIGYLPERLELPAALTPRQHLRSVARLKGLSGGDRLAGELLEHVGLAKVAQRSLGSFSKGMRQRVGLAAALLGRPRLLILDEPTDGVDPLARVEVRALLQRFLADGCTLFLNSHLLAETERICDRIGVLVGGRLLRQGALHEVRGERGGFRLRFVAGLAPAALDGLGFVAGERPGEFNFAGEPVALNAALERARAAGALLLELSPAERPLEEILAEAVHAA